MCLRFCFLCCCLCLGAQLFAQRSNFAHISFHRADSVAANHAGHSLLDQELLSQKLTRDLSSDVEKFRAIYKWVSENIRYDYATYRKNQAQRDKLKTPEALRQWNEQLRVTVFKNLIQHKKTVCTGYAYLVKELSNYAGLSCEIVDGYGRNVVSNVRGPAKPNHQWNAVRLNGQWYLADATWSSGTYNLTEHVFNKHYDDGYFLADPKIFVRNHYPLDTAWLLLTHKPTLSEFIARPLVYRGAYHYQVQEIFPATFDVRIKRNEPLSFGFKTSPAVSITNATLQIEEGNTKEEIPLAPLENEPGTYRLDHVFKSKGKRAVHVLANGEYLFSFSVDTGG